jgi:hypothetical protein
MNRSTCQKLTFVCVVVTLCLQVADIVFACQRLQKRREYVEMMEARAK